MQERKHDQLWYLPAGRVEPGETLEQAACRECLEETGIPVELEGVLRVQYTPAADGSARLRAIFVARPASDADPKTMPDEHSLRARWVTLEQLHDYELRSEEVRKIFSYVLEAGPMAPAWMVGLEGDPW